MEEKSRGAWVAQAVRQQLLILVQVMIRLTEDSHSLSPSVPPHRLLSLSLSLSLK